MAEVRPEHRRAVLAWLDDERNLAGRTPTADDVEALARLVAATEEREREACARECDDEARRSKKPDNRRAADPRAAFRSGACRCAWRIRARGKAPRFELGTLAEVFSREPKP